MRTHRFAQELSKTKFTKGMQPPGVNYPPYLSRESAAIWKTMSDAEKAVRPICNESDCLTN